MWLTISGNHEETATVSQVWTDLEAVVPDFLHDVHLRVKVGHHHFDNDAERHLLGSCQQISDKMYELVLRPATSGALYRIALHEVGHALGLEHSDRGVMVPAVRQRGTPLTLERRRRWLRDFGRKLLDQRLASLAP